MQPTQAYILLKQLRDQGLPVTQLRTFLAVNRSTYTIYHKLLILMFYLWSANFRCKAEPANTSRPKLCFVSIGSHV